MIYQSDVGHIWIKATDEVLMELHFMTDVELKEALQSNVNDSASHSHMLDKILTQLTEYFAGDRQVFSVPLHPVGTAFMQDVWNALQKIPYGQRRSYGEIAASIGRPKAARAVGMACNRNPIALIIPCHRVVGANGSLVGFRGGTDIKERLLALESAEEAKA